MIYANNWISASSVTVHPVQSSVSEDMFYQPVEGLDLQPQLNFDELINSNFKIKFDVDSINLSSADLKIEIDYIVKNLFEPNSPNQFEKSKDFKKKIKKKLSQKLNQISNDQIYGKDVF